MILMLILTGIYSDLRDPTQWHNTDNGPMAYLTKKNPIPYGTPGHILLLAPKSPLGPKVGRVQGNMDHFPCMVEASISLLTKRNSPKYA